VADVAKLAGMNFESAARNYFQESVLAQSEGPPKKFQPGKSPIVLPSANVRRKFATCGQTRMNYGTNSMPRMQ
jgi:hypothetical protein